MWHAWRYDVASGRLVNPPSTRLCLASYPVRVEDDSILIGPRVPDPPPPA
jgi:nitrite reductase/ring-hydroxylating ferredoxin subunit